MNSKQIILASSLHATSYSQAFGDAKMEAGFLASYLEHLGVALLCADVQRCSSPAVCGVHLGTKVHQILHNEVLVGSYGHLKGTLWTFKERCF